MIFHSTLKQYCYPVFKRHSSWPRIALLVDRSLFRHHCSEQGLYIHNEHFSLAGIFYIITCVKFQNILHLPSHSQTYHSLHIIYGIMVTEPFKTSKARTPDHSQDQASFHYPQTFCSSLACYGSKRDLLLYLVFSAEHHEFFQI